jgi:hypothetical protein
MRPLTIFALGAFALAALVHVQNAHGQGAPSAPPKRAPLASPADVEPAVDVSEPRVALIDAPPPQPAAPASTAAPPSARPAATPPGAAAQQSPGVAQQNASKPPASKPPSSPAPNSRAMDTLDLGTTSITGNQELPKVLYIVPWKKSDLGDLVGRPVNTLLDEVLEPVDPEVFQRHLSYYDALYGNGQKGKE